MEAGGLEFSPESQSVYQGDNIGLPYASLDACRLRYFGGTSNHWDGYTRPLDVRDFEPLPHHPLNEWPIKQEDLNGYSARADEILDLPSDQPPPSLFGEKETILKPIELRPSAPTRFGPKYKEELASSELVSLCLNANLVDIQLDTNLQAVSSVLFRSNARTEPFAISARYIVVCCGGLENARILLNSNHQIPGGIGNQHDLVGRFFSEHLEVEVGHAIMASPLKSPSIYIANNDLILARQCLSFFAELYPLRAEETRFQRYADSALCALPFSQRMGRALLGRDPICFDAVVVITTEQAVNPDSRVTLSDRTDRFGLRHLSLDWRLTDLDYHTVRTAALELGRALAQHGVGRMRLSPSLLDPSLPIPKIGSQDHHMCTTRMSDDPKIGVVDRNCRVHGVENLYMGGSSVFASGGVSNPTYSIVQLALRLADHLGSRLD